MLDIEFIHQNLDRLKETCRNKNVQLDFNVLLKLDKKRRQLKKQIDNLRRDRNTLSNKIAGLKEETQKKSIINQVRLLKPRLKQKEQKYRAIKKQWMKLMLQVPNIYSEDTPIGKDESNNKEVYRWGKPPQFDFQPRDHIQLAKDLDLIDFEQGTNVSGFRGYYLKNEAALMQIALMWHTMLKLKKKDFQLMIPPTLLREFVLIGSGHFPQGKQEIYQVANPGKLADGAKIEEPIYLSGTAESPLLAYWANKILEEKQLPVKMAGFSQCYRSEVGSYGKDTRGLYRLHEFMKVEQVVLCEADIKQSNQFLQEITKNAQEILEQLKLPYRVIQICTGDMGLGKYKMYDIETWMPSRHSFGETHSASNLLDWQARRLNIKYRTEDGTKKLVYALNNTGLASPRILIAIFENYQTKEGYIKVPKVLQKYLGMELIKGSRK